VTAGLQSVQPAVGRDEQVNLTARLYDLNEWLIGLTTETELQDLNGVSYGKTRTFYDGLALGRASAGLVTKVSRYHADEDRWLDTEASCILSRWSAKITEFSYRIGDPR
jgi:hypothetical protein